MVATINSNNTHFKPRKPVGKHFISDLATEIRSTTGEVPPPLIGASTTVLEHHVYVFGGRVASTRQMTNHLSILNLSTLEWQRHIAPPDSAIPPAPRYFHSASTYLDRYIVIFGGMGNVNGNKKMVNMEEKICAMDDVSIFDVQTMCWLDIKIGPSIFTPQARYAHISTVWDTDKLVIIGGQDVTNQHVHEISIFDLGEKAWVYGGSFPGTHDAYRTIPFSPTVMDNSLSIHGKSVLPFWKDTNQSPLCIYSNYNFQDVHRDLISFNPMNSSKWNEHTSAMTGPLQPPGLRFPTGHLMGDYLVVSGTHQNASHKVFQVWALNLVNLTWSPIDTSSLTVSGSWNRGFVSQQKCYVLGHAMRDLQEDYSYRRTNFDHIAVIDLQIYGVHSPPDVTCSVTAQELGLSLLNDPGMSDIVIWTTDQRRILVNSIILSQRWQGFAHLLKTYQPSSSTVKEIQKKQFFFPENYAVTLAFLQYIYTDHLTTPQQYQPQILCRLLILADMYHLKRLEELATFALHQSLTISTASLVYETATLTSQGALQVRALKMMISAKRIIANQLQPTDPENTTHWVSPSDSTTTSSSYSDNETLSPSSSSIHSSNYSGIRRLASLSPSTSEKMKYMYTTPPGSAKTPSFSSFKKNLTTRS